MFEIEARSPDPSLLPFSHSRNFAASAGCLEDLVMKTEDPPMNPTLSFPAVHWGRGAAAHLPAVPAATLLMTPGAQTPADQVRMLPSPTSLFHSGVRNGCLYTAPVAASFCQ